MSGAKNTPRKRKPSKRQKEHRLIRLNHKAPLNERIRTTRPLSAIMGSAVDQLHKDMMAEAAEAFAEAEIAHEAERQKILDDRKNCEDKRNWLAGRRLLLDRLRFDAIIEATSYGTPLEFAAGLAGVAYDTAREWRARGREDEAAGKLTLYSVFSVFLKRAEGEHIQRNCLVISAASRESWQAAAWSLERKLPEQFALRPNAQRVEHTGAEGKPIQTENKHLVAAVVTEADLPSFEMNSMLSSFMGAMTQLTNHDSSANAAEQPAAA